MVKTNLFPSVLTEQIANWRSKRQSAVQPLFRLLGEVQRRESLGRIIVERRSVRKLTTNSFGPLDRMAFMFSCSCETLRSLTVNGLEELLRFGNIFFAKCIDKT